jgi:ornithine cyclodeaminase
MVQYVGVKNMVRLVRAVGVEPFLIGLAGAIEADFRRWPSFEKAPRVPSHSENGVIELMPTSDGELYGFKYVNGHPGNTRFGLQTVTGFGVLSDSETGYPLLLTEMTLLTALRTAATSALAASYLARDDASVMAVIGLGSQSEFQALAFKALLGIRRLRVFDIDPRAARKFRANLAPYGFEIVTAASAEEAVLGSDIITTITADKQRATVLTDNMVGAGVHLNAVGGDCPGKTELAPGIVQRSTVFVELPEQTRIDGEIQQMAPDFPVTELWRVITGEAAGRQRDDEITLFDSVGFAIEDFAALRHVRALVAGTDYYEDIDLLTAPDDPRDLFGLLKAPATARVAVEA